MGPTPWVRDSSTGNRAVNVPFSNGSESGGAMLSHLEILRLS